MLHNAKYTGYMLSICATSQVSHTFLSTKTPVKKSAFPVKTCSFKTFWICFQVWKLNCDLKWSYIIESFHWEGHLDDEILAVGAGVVCGWRALGHNHVEVGDTLPQVLVQLCDLEAQTGMEQENPGSMVQLQSYSNVTILFAISWTSLSKVETVH